MRLLLILVFSFVISTCFGQKFPKDSMYAMVRIQIKKLDSLCDRIESQVVHPRFSFSGRAKIKYYSSTNDAVSHKVKIRFTNGFRYKKDIYRYESRQKITIVSIDDKEAMVLWKRKDEVTGALTAIKMVRLDDSTMVWSSVRNEPTVAP